MRPDTKLPRGCFPKSWKLARATAVALTASLMAAAGASEGHACGYENPQAVSKGFLNWLYPDSLYVIGAISREVAAGRLPLTNFDQTGPDLFGRRFRLTATALEQFGKMLGVASPCPSRPSVTLVVVEPMLWTRFHQGPEGWRTTVHVSGGQRGDLVLVAGEAVITEIAARRLTLGQAAERGVVRLYGSAPQIAQFLLSYSQVGASDGAFQISQQPMQSHRLGIAPPKSDAQLTTQRFHEGEKP